MVIKQVFVADFPFSRFRPSSRLKFSKIFKKQYGNVTFKHRDFFFFAFFVHFSRNTQMLTSVV